MSVYLDHVYIKPTKSAYKELLTTFKQFIGEDLLQYGEHVDGENKWGGFYVYFDNGSFLEVLDPEVCTDSQSVGLCISCEKEFRGHFIGQIEDVLKDQAFESKSFPVEDPSFSICRLNPDRFLTTWGVEYSDQWFKEWGSRSSKFGLLYPTESFRSLNFTYPNEQKPKVVDNLHWIDPRACEGEINLPLKDSGATSLSFNKGEQAACDISFFIDSQEVSDLEVSGEDYKLMVKDGVLSLKTNLTM